MVTVNVVVLAGTVAADPVEGGMPSGDEVTGIRGSLNDRAAEVPRFMSAGVQRRHMVWVVLGIGCVAFGVYYVIWARHLSERGIRRVERLNKRRSGWFWQNPEGWSVALVRTRGVLAILAGAFVIAFGVSQLAS